MAERRDYVALDWVSGEIDETLKQACHALEAYVAEPGDTTQLRFCLTYANQVQGTLRMVEFHGAALFAHELEQLLQAMLGGELQDKTVQAVEAAMAGLLHLPGYLDQVRSARRDLPGILLPRINDMRAIRGVELMSEAAFFNPELPPVKGNGAAPGDVDLPAEVARLKQMFQVAFVGIVRKKQLGQNLECLADICDQLEALSRGSSHQALWHVARALVDGVADQSIHPNASIKTLLKEIDTELKGLQQAGMEHFSAREPSETLKQFLYLIARAESESQRIVEVQQSYRLQEVLEQTAEQAEAQADPDALRSVVDVLMEELASVKDFLDLQGRGSDQGMESIQETLPLIKRVGDTMAVLGFVEPLAMVRAQGEALEAYIARGDSEDRDSLLPIAEQIVAVEEALQAYLAPGSAGADSGQHQLDSARETVLRETRKSLEAAKECVIDFVASQWDHARLEALPGMLRALSGSLDMAGTERAARILDACEHYVRGDLLEGKQVPEWQMLEKLADAISGVDYFLERTAEDQLGDNEAILDVAADSVAMLGHPVEKLDATDGSVSAPLESVAEDVEDALAITSEVPAVTDQDLQQDEATLAEEPVAEEGQSETEEQVAPEQEAEVVAEAVAEEEAEMAGAEASAQSVSATTGGETYPFTLPVEEETEEPLDEEIAEIFVEEAGEVLETIAANLPQWQADPANQDALGEVRRAYHTLKGSGRMVGACVLGELAWSVENMLNRVIENVFPAEAVHTELVARVTALVPTMVAVFEKQQAVNKSYVDAVAAMAEAMSNKEPVAIESLAAIDARWLDAAACSAAASDQAAQIEEQVPAGEEAAAPAEVTADIEVADTDAEPDVQNEGEAELAVQAEADEPVEVAQADGAEVEAQVDNAEAADEDAAVVASQAEEQSESDALLDIFGAEAEAHLAVMQEFVVAAEASEEATLVSDGLQRALHTLKGCARMAGVDALGNIISPLESLVKQLQAAQVGVDSEVLEVIRDITRLAYIGLNMLQEQGECQEFSETPALVARIEALIETHVPVAEEAAGEDKAYLERVGEFMIETADRLASITATLSRWDGQGETAEGDWFILTDYPAAIARAATELELAPLAQLGDKWSESAARLEGSAVSQELVALYTRAAETLETMLDSLAADQAFAELDGAMLEQLATLAPAVIEEQDATLAEQDVEEAANDAAPAEAEPVEEAQPVEEAAAQPIEDDTPEQPEPEAQVTAAAAEAEDDDVDQEMVDIFMEEARDLLETIDETIHRWLEDRQSREAFELLQRCLHTLKGGARLTGLSSLGNLSHNFETFLISAEEQGVNYDDNFMGRVQQYQDQVVAVVDRVMAGADVPEIEEEEPVLPEPNAEPVEMMDVPDVPAANEPAPSAMADNPQLKVVTQEAVKMPAHVIEQLVNLAGETSINRGRVEEQVSDVMFSLTEMDATIERMREQLRRLDIETEQQLIFRQEQVESMGIEEFDPLEMDRYSVLQQLSRSLAESASDIQEVKNSIFNKSRDVETLLLQQSRINTDLQEGLMRSRMVPFSRLVPRLRRIVRQVSVELGKNVNLELLNTEGEMDRTILERMVPSFEHMLRNAVDHGIESADARQQAGKPASGNISISLAREAGDVVITLADDGRGINLEAVRRKAIERGMMDAKANLSDHEVLQFILQSGFSTAEAVTQISGRGVGLDVVASEIKQIGGTVDIQSDFGRGTRFVIRLPFTVSVNRALMVQSCGETYALPLNTIEGIVRVSPFELEAYYKPDAPLFEYAGQSYQLRYMGALLRKKAVPDLQEETLPLPVILVRSGEHSFAVQVDNLLGSREIVVKTLGPQFASVQGLSGATVLGDGGVVVILDLHAMIRTDVSLPQLTEMIENAEQPVEEVDENRNLVVMVVDDSVTVRKVTSRLLERHGMDVLLAKDGVDAMQQLQDHKPDVMLLDIEMPRMDGFEVASRVKHSSKLKNLPIIMITSRTGDKHRERAESIGVDKYLGKPFQEIELLGNIQELTGHEL